MKEIQMDKVKGFKEDVENFINEKEAQRKMMTEA
jgi:hypothetical protein